MSAPCITVPTGRSTTSARIVPLLAALAVSALLVTGCARQDSRPTPVRGAQLAAARTVALDPGTPPAPTVRPLVLEPRKRTTPGNEVDIAPAAPTGYPDVWARVRDRLRLPRDAAKRIGRELEWYRGNQDYLDRTAERARRYLPFIAREVERRNLPGELALLPVVESAFQPFAYSRAGASGLWQFIRSTGKLYGLRQNWWYDGRRDVLEATRAALDYLEKLRDDFDGDWLLAVAAYNSGEGNVQRAVSRNRRHRKPTDFWSLRLPRETQSYVPRLLAVAALVADPQRYGITLSPIPDEVEFTVVALEGQIDLGLAAEVARVPLDEIYLLNPGFNRFATDPAGPHRLLLPRAAALGFSQRLAAVPVQQRVRWARHKVARGETLGGIAQRYHTNVRAITRANTLASRSIHAGSTLLIPVARRAPGRYALGTEMRRNLARSAERASPSRVHVVRRGENPWTISRRYRVPLARLLSWNGLSTRSVLHPGQRLKLYAGAALTTPAKRKPSANSRRTYVVRRGDNLSVIADRHGTTVKRLVRWNDLGRNDLLRPGQRLFLVAARTVADTPGDAAGAGPRRIRYTVQRGDSLWFISQRFKVSIASLRQWNTLSKGQLLHPGQTLEVHLPAGSSYRES